MKRGSQYDTRYVLVAFTHPIKKKVFLRIDRSVASAKASVNNYANKVAQRKRILQEFYRDVCSEGLDYFEISILAAANSSLELSKIKEELIEKINEDELLYSKRKHRKPVAEQEWSTIKVFTITSPYTNKVSVYSRASEKDVRSYLERAAKYKSRTRIHSTELLAEVSAYGLEGFVFEVVFESTDSKEIQTFMDTLSNQLKREGRLAACKTYRPVNTSYVSEITEMSSGRVYVKLGNFEHHAETILRAMENSEVWKVKPSSQLWYAVKDKGYANFKCEIIFESTNRREALAVRRRKVKEYKAKNISLNT